jgi:hypothetical protein
MSRIVRHLVGVVALTFITGLAHSAWAVTANPLESAYWRFEEGTAGSKVAGGVPNTVLDSINQNHMQTDAAGAVDPQPLYTSRVAPTPLKSGQTDNVALEFESDDFIIAKNAASPPKDDGKNIDNGIFGAPGGPTGFTVEAAFQPSVVDSNYHSIISKQGQPVAGNPIETFELKVRGDTHKLQVEQFDGSGSGVPQQITSTSAINANQWYYAAVVNNGSTMSLYLNSNDGNGYILQGSTPVSGSPLYQGTPTGYWSQAWNIGRGNYGGTDTDWFNGIIDEVRISNSALAPWQFLFAPQGDYNGDNVVDGADYAIWRKTNVFSSLGYTTWRSHYGSVYGPGSGVSVSAVPEPASLMLAAFSLFGFSLVCRGDRRRGYRS